VGSLRERRGCGLGVIENFDANYVSAYIFSTCLIGGVTANNFFAIGYSGSGYAKSLSYVPLKLSYGYMIETSFKSNSDLNYPHETPSIIVGVRRSLDTFS
jgi:hypothetical protein